MSALLDGVARLLDSTPRDPRRYTAQVMAAAAERWSGRYADVPRVSSPVLALSLTPRPPAHTELADRSVA